MPRSLRDRAGGRRAFGFPDVMDDAHLIVAVAAEIVTRYGDKAVPRLRDDARLRCGPAISGLTRSTATQAVTSSIHNCRMRLLRGTECGARNADFVVTGCGDQF